MTSAGSSDASSAPLPPEVNSVDEAMGWLTDTAALYRSLGEAYGTYAYTVAANTLTATTKEIRSRDVTATATLRDVLSEVAGQLRVRAATADRSSADATAFGLTLAATDIAGLSAALHPTPEPQIWKHRTVAPTDIDRSL